MTITGYDADVAAANGFKIVTAADGSQSSVPVTDAAQTTATKLAAATAAAAAKIGDPVTVRGDCGTSFIQIVNGISSTRKITTGYNVVNFVEERVWGVTLYGFAGIKQIGFSGGAGEPHWQSTKSVSYGSGGFGNVTPGSFVILSNGGLCTSGSPGANF